MQPQTARVFSFLHFLTLRRYTALCERFGTLDEACHNINEGTLQWLGLRKETRAEVLQRYVTFHDERYARDIEDHSLHLLTIEDDLYPQLLRTANDPPVFLYVQGNVLALQQQTISIVGTRTMNSAGKRITQMFVGPLVRAGLTTISGLAFGIDTEVANVTLEHGGATVAVLAGGLHTITPVQNTALVKKIVAQGGAIVSEYALDIIPQKHNFIARNRIIAALSTSTLVLQAPEGSGALITARLAQEYNRDVFAVPGSIFDEKMVGCNALIAQHVAQIAYSPSQLLLLLQRNNGMRFVEPVLSSRKPTDPQNLQVWQLLTKEPQSIEELCLKLSLPVMTVIARLSQLEVENAAECIANEGWVRL